MSVTTSGLVMSPRKCSRMKASMSFTSPVRSDSSIICVPEYESISCRYSEAVYVWFQSYRGADFVIDLRCFVEREPDVARSPHDHILTGGVVTLVGTDLRNTCGPPHPAPAATAPEILYEARQYLGSANPSALAATLPIP